jgi:DNA repair exonuclease SbcCD nuclease subunit
MKLAVAIVCFCLVGCEGLRIQSDSPPKEEPSVCLVGDVHFGHKSHDTRFKQLVKRISEAKCAEVVLLGDLTEHGKIEELKAVNQELLQLSGKQIYAIPGNHDTHSQTEANWPLKFDKLKNFITIMGEDHHVLELPEATIVVTNSDVLITQEQDPELKEHRKASWAKLEQSLRAASERNRAIVLITHQPLIDNNWEEQDSLRHWPVAERNRLLSMLPKSSTTHILAGHTHETKSLHFQKKGRTIEQQIIQGTGPRAKHGGTYGPSWAEITAQDGRGVQTKVISLDEA